MPTQHDSIQAPYDAMRTTSISLIEHVRVQSAVAPFIKDARVLDPACGSALYSYDLLNWGASRVNGVDISSAMIDQARAAAAAAGSQLMALNTGSIEFQVADGSKPIAYESGPLDLVFAVWLLNYARDGRELADMFRNVALNLKDGGRFITVCPPATQDPTAFY